jgi:hypothetical protein
VFAQGVLEPSNKAHDAGGLAAFFAAGRVAWLGIPAGTPRPPGHRSGALTSGARRREEQLPGD